MKFRRTRLPKFNKHSADPQILHEYRELRNERRRDVPLLAAMVVALVCVISLAVVIIFPMDATPTIVGIIAAVGIVGIYGFLFLTAFWSPSSRRTAVVGAVCIFLAIAILGAFAGDWLMGLLY